MSVVDIHPEDLLHKDSRGDLTADEAQCLEAHLARCSACRAERVLRFDFAEELAEEERPSATLGLVQGPLASTNADSGVLHPEDLLDKESRGGLTAGESVRLQAHLARCAACRAERVLRLNFAAELEAEPSAMVGLVPAARKDAEANAGVGALPDADLARLGIARLRRRRPARTAIVMLFAATILAAGAAGATGMTSRLWSNVRGAALDTKHPELAPSAPTPPTSRPTSRPTSPVTSPVTSPAAAPADLDLDPVAAPLLAPPFTVTRAPVSPTVLAPVRTPALVPAPALATPRASAAPTSASAMFEAANAARRAGDTATALALYDGLDRQFPGSREARSAKATGGRLLLDSGNAVGALGHFDAYLASGSSELREEAMAGRAMALERLGRDEQESRAWAALLATYPRTPYASHARARVARVGPSDPHADMGSPSQ